MQWTRGKIGRRGSRRVASRSSQALAVVPHISRFFKTVIFAGVPFGLLTGLFFALRYGSAFWSL